MTKEKIIINGIDVTECLYRRQNPHNFCMCSSVIKSGDIIELTRYVQCEYNPNCYFKQRARVMKENAELQEKTASIIYSLTGGRLSYSTYTLKGCEQAYHDQLEIDVERATKELQKKLQAKEQLSVKQSHELIRLRKERQENKQKNVNLLQKNEELEKQLENEKQALDEIENYVRDNSDFDKNDKLTSNTGAYDILEIINKAKAVSNAR